MTKGEIIAELSRQITEINLALAHLENAEHESGAPLTHVPAEEVESA